MIRADVDIVNKLGLHARAAAKLVSCASRFASQIQIAREGRSANGKSIMGVMMLAASQGSRITLEVCGEDEIEAFDALRGLVASRFGEDE